MFVFPLLGSTDGIGSLFGHGSWLFPVVLCAVIYHKNSLKSVLLLLFKAFTGELICLKTFHKEKRKKSSTFVAFPSTFGVRFISLGLLCQTLMGSSLPPVY